MDHNAENTNRPLALILTFGTHGILFLFLFLFYITTPVPPYPEGGGSGLGVNFGTSDDGFGSEQPEKLLPLNLKETENEEKAVHKKAAKADEFETQETEASVALKKNEKKNEKKVNEREKKEDIAENKETKEVKAEKKRDVDKKTLFKGSSDNNSKSEGETHGSGDQGKKEGNPGSKYHWGSGDGKGNGDGKGDGKGNGDGDGKGNKKGTKAGKDNGVSFNLKGRKAEGLPLPDYNDDDEGKVVIDVIVDREGNVTQATEGKGTTTSSMVLKNAAKRAAKKAKFSKNPDAAEFQKGSITYIFKQQ